jgi:hypothetical protein
VGEELNYIDSEKAWSSINYQIFSGLQDSCKPLQETDQCPTQEIYSNRSPESYCTVLLTNGTSRNVHYLTVPYNMRSPLCGCAWKKACINVGTTGTILCVLLQVCHVYS